MVACSMGRQFFHERSRPVTSPGKPRLRQLAEAHRVEHLPHVLRRQGQRHLGDTDVGRLLDHLRHGQRAMRVGVGNRGAADGDAAGRTVDHRIGAELAALQRQRRGKRLERRPRLEGVGQRPVPQLGPRQAFAIVRVVGRQIDQRQDLAAADINDDDAAGLGPVDLDRRLELAVSQVLDLRIERQANVLAILRRFQRSDVFDDVAAAVTDDGTAAVASDETRLEGPLDAFEPLVVDAGKADDVRRHVARGVVSGGIPFPDGLPGSLSAAMRSAVSGETWRLTKVKVFSEAILPSSSRTLMSSSAATGRFCPALMVRASAGIAQIDFIGVDTASMSPLRSTILPREAETSISRQIARFALFLQEVVVDDLQIEAARRPARQKGAHQEQADRARTPALQGQLQHRALGDSGARAGVRRRTTISAPPSKPAWAAGLVAGLSTTLPVASGVTMRRRPRAICSMRGWVAQVDSSSCNCPYSTSS
jgi:hypothetical protein